jgi:hypothetical protein
MIDSSWPPSDDNHSGLDWTQTMTHHIQCSEIWGGIRGDQLEAESSGLRASLFSRACEGGKGGNIYDFSVCSSELAINCETHA